jgi:peptidoglycan/LPS O-acetylase OafA/YrhL
MNYRRDIDGLRAIAILPVVLYHANTPFFTGGYVGVDVFFVISGYLITTVVLSDISEGTFSLSQFYERRVRRLFPAYFIVIFFILAVGAFISPPNELRGTAAGTLASTFYVSNFFFWGRTNYFDSEAEYTPVLHTWSLSVEEQFYVFVPIILFLLFHYAQSWMARAVLFATSCSLILCLAFEGQSSSFYLLPFRAWELGIGTLLAIHRVSLPTHRVLAESIHVVGITFIIISVSLFTDETAFPGPATMLPVFGAAFLLVPSAKNPTFVHRILSLSPFVGVGLVSYSLYLWHWPVFYWGHHVYGLEEIAVQVSVVALSIAAAIFSYQFVETPVRKKKLLASRGSLFGTCAAISVIITLTTGIIIGTEGLSFRATEEKVLSAERSRLDISLRRGECLTRRGQSRSYAGHCRLGVDGTPTFLFWGDSHAMELADAMGSIAGENSLSGIMASNAGCPPAQEYDTAYRTDCATLNLNFLNEVTAQTNLTLVILVARYHDNPRTRQEFVDGVIDTVVALTSTGKQVIVVLPIPEPGGHAPYELARRFFLNVDPSDFAVARTLHNQASQFYLDRLVQLTSDRSVLLFDPAESLCNQNRCLFYSGTDFTHFDDNHLSLTGARIVALDLMNFILSRTEVALQESKHGVK